MQIFFDIDGVLNKESDWKRPFTINDECVAAFSAFVKKLQDKGQVRLITISTWRQGDAIAKVNTALQQHGLSIYGETPQSDKGRQAEIEYYRRRNPDIGYIIIDDDPSLYDSIEEINLYIPDYRAGFTTKDTNKAVKQALESMKCS